VHCLVVQPYCFYVICVLVLVCFKANYNTNTIQYNKYCTTLLYCKSSHKPKFHQAYADFRWNFPDMSRCLRQSTWQVRDKPVCVALMEFTMHGESRRQSPLCGGHKSRKSATWFVSRIFMIYVSDKVSVMEFGLYYVR